MRFPRIHSGEQFFLILFRLALNNNPLRAFIYRQQKKKAQTKKPKLKNDCYLACLPLSLILKASKLLFNSAKHLNSETKMQICITFEQCKKDAG